MKQCLIDKKLYEDLFVDNIEKRTEYGNNHASLMFILDQKIDKSARILEIGGNIGTLTKSLYDIGYRNIVSIDITSSAIEHGKNIYPEIKEKLQLFDGQKIQFPDEIFDVVLSFDVMEHIPDVDRHLEEVKRVLKPDGRYLFQTPNKIINIPWEIIAHRSFTLWKKFHCSLHTHAQLYRRLNKYAFISVIEKRNILTEYNKTKVRKKLGYLGLLLIHCLNFLPVKLSPNFWVIAIKK